jgi:hypothetical protein
MLSKFKILEEINKFNSCDRFLSTTKKYINKNDLYVCKVEYPDQESKYIFLSKQGKEEFQRKNEDTIFIPLLNTNIERHVLYCASRSGAGKGNIVSGMTEQYHVIYPKNKIYFICAKSILKDKNFSKMIDYVKQIDIKEFEGLSEHDILNKYEDTLFIIDDNDNIPVEDQHTLQSLQKTILFLGREYHISFFKISHFKTDRENTRSLVTEIDYYVTFVNRDLENDRLLNTYKKIKKSTYDQLEGSLFAFFNFRLDYCVTNKKCFFLE